MLNIKKTSISKLLLICMMVMMYTIFTDNNVLANNRTSSYTDEIFITEENYKETMENQVEPYLNSLKSEGYFQGQEALDIYYKKYLIENSKGNIVVSHGFTESLEKYNEIIYYFLKNGYSVFAFEHRGHGRSGYLGIDQSQVIVEDYNYYVLDLKNFMDQIVCPEAGAGKIFLFAHSMGGGIGAKFLEDYKEYFDAAVLTGPMMEMKTGSFPKFIARPITWIMTILGFGSSYDIGEKPYSDDYDFEGATTTSEARYEYSHNSILEEDSLKRGGASYQWLNESYKLTKAVTSKKNASKVEIPVLLFQADNDSYVKPSGQNKFAKYAKNCELVFVENSKHSIFMEKDEILKPYLEKIFSFYNDNL